MVHILLKCFLVLSLFTIRLLRFIQIEASPFSHAKESQGRPRVKFPAFTCRFLKKWPINTLTPHLWCWCPPPFPSGKSWICHRSLTHLQIYFELINIIVKVKPVRQHVCFIICHGSDSYQGSDYMAKRSCGKVMFSQMSACPQRVGISDPMSFPGVGISGARSFRGGGYVQTGGNAQEGCYPPPRHGTWDTTGYCWQAGGMHPTKML